MNFHSKEFIDYICNLVAVAYVRLHTNLGDLNLELHADQVRVCTVLPTYLFTSVHILLLA